MIYEIQVSVSIKHLIGTQLAALCMCCLRLLLYYYISGAGLLKQTPCGPQSVKYLLSGPSLLTH